MISGGARSTFRTVVWVNQSRYKLQVFVEFQYKPTTHLKYYFVSCITYRFRWQHPNLSWMMTHSIIIFPLTLSMSSYRNLLASRMTRHSFVARQNIWQYINQNISNLLLEAKFASSILNISFSLWSRTKNKTLHDFYGYFCGVVVRMFWSVGLC